MKVKVLLLVVALAFAAPAFAGSIAIDFSGESGGLPPTGVPGTVTDSYVGAAIPINLLVFSVNGVAQVEDAVTGTCGGDGEGCLNFDTGGDGSNYINITGGVPGLGVGTSTLLSGTVSGYTFIPGPLNELQLTGPDSKGAALLAALGLSAETSWAYYGFTIYFNYDSGDVTSTDITNTTPEPLSMALMGTFLSLAGGVLARKKRA